MPRVSRAETERNRELIDDAAAELIREQGLSMSVAEVMKSAGMTSGGFYGHFSSKDELLSHACAVAFQHVEGVWRAHAAKAESKSEAYEAIIDGYLNENNLKRPGTGCPIPSLAGEVARESANKPIRTSFLDGCESLRKILEEYETSRGASRRRERSFAKLCLIVGAMSIARASLDSTLSGEVIEAARKLAKSM